MEMTERKRKGGRGRENRRKNRKCAKKMRSAM